MIETKYLIMIVLFSLGAWGGALFERWVAKRERKKERLRVAAAERAAHQPIPPHPEVVEAFAWFHRDKKARAVAWRQISNANDMERWSLCAEEPEENGRYTLFLHGRQIPNLAIEDVVSLAKQAGVKALRWLPGVRFDARIKPAGTLSDCSVCHGTGWDGDGYSLVCRGCNARKVWKGGAS